MTVTEMHTALRLNLDKSTALVGTIDFLPEELNFWLNEAQLRFIKQRLFGTNAKQSGFEGSIKRYDDLNNLIVLSGELTLSSSLIGDNIKEVSLATVLADSNNPYLYFISASLRDAQSRRLEIVDLIDHSSLPRLVEDSLNQPYIRRPLVSITKSSTAATVTGQLIVVYDTHQSFIPTKVLMTYIRQPRKLSLNGSGTYETSTSELPTSTHTEIVTIASELLLENIESQRVQTFTGINSSKME